MRLKTIIELTSAARRKAGLAGLETQLDRLSLGEWARKGDFVELAGRGETIVFMIRARRIRVDVNDVQTLVFELDHPPRPAVR
ncbi:hypothetical protein T8J41_11815 [Nitratireductor rhodophyticola]|uniref:hypothetical protein n=1 Tax=Nitratireductor rhodophyticola TaxID=2854036 RepID=UPI002AC999EE|nr:hypothetical protein [Nitratireductor rhodophyticola]MEC9244189.1 hypothetical protein [Pseudomonadota bacterium]WPZ12866.1 hypothetical protein T8J41_11815 [Nitratireductor rhodophyticola]